MMRALYTAATGMRAEQTNVDTIANNLSNVNTTGFKGQRTEFKSLLYQTIQTRSTSGNGDAKPVGAQVGLGTRVAQGNPVMDTNGNIIAVPAGVSAEKMSFGEDGAVGYMTAQGNYINLNQRIAVYQFNNPSGLEKQSGSLLAATANSGNPMLEAANPALKNSKVVTGYLEGSNVQVADEMVNLIVAQRAYELNSKAITTADSMLETANNLRR